MASCEFTRVATRDTAGVDASGGFPGVSYPSPAYSGLVEPKLNIPVLPASNWSVSSPGCAGRVEPPQGVLQQRGPLYPSGTFSGASSQLGAARGAGDAAAGENMPPPLTR
eukprot:407634-Prorocentrum_minimum.AAC.1